MNMLPGWAGVVSLLTTTTQRGKGRIKLTLLSSLFPASFQTRRVSPLTLTLTPLT
jgi:hypothetical protein